QRWSCIFRFAEPALARRSLDCADRGVTENNFCRFIRHLPKRLRKRAGNVYCVRFCSSLTTCKCLAYNGVMKTFAMTIISLMAISTFSLTTTRADQPHMQAALQQLRAALAQLEAAVPDKAGWRARAIQSTRAAISQTQNGIAAAR